MNPKEKFIIRSSILELAETGTPRNISIDEKIRIGSKERGNEAKNKHLGLYNCIGCTIIKAPL